MSRARWSIAVTILLVVAAGCTTKPDEPTPTPSEEGPLAIVTSLSQPPLDLDLDTARTLAAGELDSWEPLTGDDAPLRAAPEDPEAAIDAVLADDSVLALVPVDRLRPTVAVARVDGADPLQDPDDYPLTSPRETPVPQMRSVVVGGDVMLGRRVGEQLASGDLAAVWAEVGPVLAEADASFVNLESTLSTDGPPQQGGDSFGADPGVLDGLSDAGIDVVGLANNHLGDYGEQPLLTTLRLLREADFATVGAGENLDAAREPAIIDADGLSIGFYATDSIGETPAATQDSPGTNRIDAPPRTGPLDEAALDRARQDIAALDERADLVIAVPHWGTQYTNVPEESQRIIAQAFTEAGADVVVGGHPHWVQGWEQIEETTVVHSLGNLIFDMQFMRETQEGILVEIVATADRVLDVRPIPYAMDQSFVPRLVEDERASGILELASQASSPPFDTWLR